MLQSPTFAYTNEQILTKQFKNVCSTFLFPMNCCDTDKILAIVLTKSSSPWKCCSSSTCRNVECVSLPCAGVIQKNLLETVDAVHFMISSIGPNPLFSPFIVYLHNALQSDKCTSLPRLAVGVQNPRQDCAYSLVVRELDTPADAREFHLLMFKI